MPARNHVMFTASDKLRDAINKEANAQNISNSELIRKAVAAFLGFDLSSESKTGRPAKYPNVEARKSAAAKRARDKRALTNKIIQAAQKDDREELIRILAEQLGINVDEL